MRTVSLSALTVLPCSPLDQIDAAVAAGYDAVSLRIFPVMDTDIDVMADPNLQAAITQRIADSALTVADVEVVRLTPDLDVAALRPALAFAASLGTQWLATTACAAEQYPEDESVIVRRLDELCVTAGDYGIGVMLEFMAYRPIGSLAHALRIVEAVAAPNLAVTLDALHFFRSGAVPADLRGIPHERLACVQLCDAPAAAPDNLALEARYHRRLPGDGGLALAELLDEVPDDLAVCVEVPSRDSAHLSVNERARLAFERTRMLMAGHSGIGHG